MKNPHECRCKPHATLGVDTYITECRYGNCTEWRCIGCDANLSGFGLAGCKCTGYIREIFHPDMRQYEHHTAVKSSILSRRNRKPIHRERITR